MATAYGYFLQSAPTPTTATVTTGSWSERTGSWGSYYSTYYVGSGTSSRTATSGTFGNNVYGSYTAQITGSVTGFLGQTLTGTETVVSTSSFGGKLTYTANVTIDPAGNTTTSYTGGSLTGPGTFTGTASGSGTSKPGTYFEQMVSAGMIHTSLAPYSQVTRTNWAGPGYGQRTGYLPGGFSATVNLTERTVSPSGPVPNSYLPVDYGDMGGEVFKGVVDPATGQGVMSVYGPQDNTVLVAGPVTITPSGPDIGRLSWTPYYSMPSNLGGNILATGSWNQIPGTMPPPGNYNFTQTYQGQVGLNVTNSTLANVFNMGWGQRTGVLNSYFTLGLNQGSWQVISGPGFTNGFNSNLSSASMSGSVTGVLGAQQLTGNLMTFTGTLSNGLNFSYQGSVTIGPDGHLTFTYRNGGGYTSTWNGVLPGQTGTTSGTATGTLTQWAGAPVTQNASGTYTSTPSGNNALVTSAFTGTQTGALPGNFKGSSLATLNFTSPPPSGSGNLTMTATGVLNGNPQESIYGVMTQTTTYTPSSGSPSTVTTTAQLQGPAAQPVTTFGGSQPSAGVNWMQGVATTVPSSSTNSTATFITNTSGANSYSMTTNADKSAATFTTPSPMTGTMNMQTNGVLQTTGGPSPTPNIPVNTTLNVTSTTTPAVPNAFAAIPSSGQANVGLNGGVAGPSGGTMTGTVSSSGLTVPTVPSGSASICVNGAATYTPTPTPVLNVAVNNTAPLMGTQGVLAQQTGTVTVKP